VLLLQTGIAVAIYVYDFVQLVAKQYDTTSLRKH